MNLHRVLPLVAFLLNVSLAGLAVFRNPGSRLNRTFAYFASGMAVWNFGVFLLRQAPDEVTALFWEVVIHVGVIAIPAFYYHFVLIFLDSTTRHRRSLAAVYLLSLFFGVLDLSGSSLFLKGVVWTRWGWAPIQGVFYTPFVLFFNAFMFWGIARLRAVSKMGSSFRRNRARLIVLGTAMSVGGGFIDFLRIILAKSFPQVDHVYPVGIPANALFALMLGVSIVRYRLFDVNTAVKKTVTYALAGGAITAVIALSTWSVEQYFDLERSSALWVVGPLGILVTVLVSPFGQRVSAFAERLTFSKRQGCYDTLLDLSKQMSTILDFGRLVDTLVEGLVKQIPLTRCTLLIYEPAVHSFVPYRKETSLGEDFEVSQMPADSVVVEWLRQEPGVLVKEEVKINPRIAEQLDTAEAEIDAIDAALIVPLRIEHNLVGIVLLGEKLSGEIFDAHELEVLSVLASQAAIALQNARLYEEVGASNARLRQASLMKSQFLANMSHELRTPLNSIIGFSKVLLKRIDGDINERQETYIRSVHNSSVHLLQLINDILDFSKIEAGKLDMRPEEIELEPLVDECIESSVALVRGKPVKIEKNVPQDLPKLYVDRTKIKQVVLNLLSNAIKFTAAGHVVVRLQREPSALQVTVADTGIGIPAADLPRLFEPFERLANPRAKDAGGTGLGLAISKKFVELHGGHIWAESRENHGSSFHFTLPLGTPSLESQTT